MLVKASGTCLCKALKSMIEGRVLSAMNCHCNICKKSTGAAFQTVAVTRQKSLLLKQGTNELKAYELGDKAVKYFCGRCGTPIYNTHQDFPGLAMIYIGSLDEPCRLTPTTNLFCLRMLPRVNNIAELENVDQLR